MPFRVMMMMMMMIAGGFFWIRYAHGVAVLLVARWRAGDPGDLPWLISYWRGGNVVWYDDSVVW